MASNEVALAVTKTRQWMEAPERMVELAKCLPVGMTPESFMRAVMTTHLRSPKLYETTLESRWLAIVTAAQLGLPFDGRMAALVPFKNQAQFIPMYQGLMQLAYRHPKVAMIHAMPVFDGDEYRYVEGLHPRIEHTPVPRQTTPKPEEIIACYAIAKVRGGGSPFAWMYRYEIEQQHRDVSKQYQRNEGPWITNPIPMYVKTAVIKLAKFIPQSVELVRALAVEDDPEQERPLPPLPVGDAGVDALLDAIAGESHEQSE